MMSFQKLSEGHLPMVGAFSCIETDDMLKAVKSKEKRRIRGHSADMDKFLKEHAFHDQELGVSTTHLLIDDEDSRILAYISLCNDAIQLDDNERGDSGIDYASAPSLKIARLAVDAKYAGRGIGKQMIEFAAYQSQLMREYTGVFFLTLDCYKHRVSYYESIGFVKNKIQPIILPYDSPFSMRLSINEYLDKLMLSE